MKLKRTSRVIALILIMSLALTSAACRRTPGKNDETLRMDITVEASDNEPSSAPSQPPAPPPSPPPSPTPGPQSGIEEDDDNTDLVPRPDRHFPFQPVTAGFENDDMNIRMIEINQCLSYGFDTETGEFYPMENFVAGKETAIFVSFEEPFDPNSPAVLTIERNRQVVARLTPVGIPDAYTMLFQPRDMADVNYWEAGAYSFTFEMDGCRAVRTVNFYESTKLRILGVPILANYSGRIVSCSGEWRNGADMVIATYPVARADVEYILYPELDLTHSRYDLNTSDGIRNVWEALVALQTKNRDYALIVGYVREVVGRGVFPQGGALGYTRGLPASVVVEDSPDWIATVPHEIAHGYKIGDEYQGGHMNIEANTPPYGMSGLDIITYQPVTAENPLVIGGRAAGIIGVGSVIYEEQRAYHVEGGNLLGAVTSYMGSGVEADSYTMWTTSQIWDHIYRVYVGHVAGDPGYGTGSDTHVSEYWGQCPSCFESVYDPDFYVECWQCCEFIEVTSNDFQCPNCQANWLLDDYSDDLYMECSACRYFVWYNWFEQHNNGAAQRSDDMIVGGGRQGMFTRITGSIDADGSYIYTPWYTYAADRNMIVPASIGEYGVYVYDSEGSLLAVTYFNPERYAQVITPEGPMFLEQDVLSIDISVRFPANAAQIVLRRHDETLYTQVVSPNTPTVAFTGLSDYQELDNIITLTWDAFDEDGDELYFDVWYCPSELESFNIAANITGRSIDVDLSAFPGSNSGYFYIYVTDGVRTSESDSPFVSIPFKSPMILAEPDGIPEFKLTDRIDFDARAYDMQDGWLYGSYFDGSASSVLWTYNGQEYYHNSELTIFPFELTPGLHTFTCTATNSAGMTARRDYTFRIIDDDSDLPDDWSREDIRTALSWGFILPLDRLDAPVTRGNIAEMMTTTYGLFSALASGDLDLQSNPYPDYEDGLITDTISEWDLWHQFVMVYLGVMEAPDGMFDASGTLTEREAALILYKVTALAIDDPDILDADVDESFVSELFDRANVFDRTGPNAFNGPERLTNRLAMVRSVRFITYMAYQLMLTGNYTLPD